MNPGALAGRRIRVDHVGPIHLDPARADGILATPDPQTGFLHLDGRLTRTGVFRYRDAEGNEWGELRVEADVFDAASLASFRAVVLTDDHPEQFVDIRNVADVQAGHVGSDVRREAAFVRASIVVTDAQAILAIQRGKCELSCGYTAELVEEAGTLDGVAYAARQTNIRGNHVAIVDKGRAGAQCRLIGRGDGSAITVASTMQSNAPQRADANDTSTEQPMKLDLLIKDAQAALKAKKLDQAKHLIGTMVAQLKATGSVASATPHADAAASETASSVIELLTLAQKTGNEILIEAALTAAGGMMNATPEPEPMVEESAATPAALPAAPAGFDAAEAVKLRAKVDALEAERARDKASEAGRIDARVKLVSQARAICPELKTDGLGDDQLMTAVVLAVSPERKDMADKVKLHGAGYLRAAFDAAIELHAARDQHTGALSLAAFRATEDGADGDDPDKEHADMIKRRDAAWKPAKKSA